MSGSALEDLQVWHLFHARTAPRCPKIENDDFSSKLGESSLPSRNGERKVFGLFPGNKRFALSIARRDENVEEKDHRPPWPLVTTFADNLTHELRGKQLTNAQNTALRECLSEAVHRTGTSNARLASRLQGILATGGLTSSKTQVIISDFIKLREFVQGPDDLPVRDVPVRH